MIYDSGNGMAVHGGIDPANKSYLADVLRLWNCTAQRWVVHSPIVLRFENDDIVLTIRDVDSRCVGSVFDISVVSLPETVVSGAGVRCAPEESECICWRSDAGYDARIGYEYNVFELCLAVASEYLAMLGRHSL